MNTIIDVFSSKFKKSESDKSITKGFGLQLKSLKRLCQLYDNLYSLSFGLSVMHHHLLFRNQTWKLGPVVKLSLKSKQEQLASRIRLLSAFSTGGLGILKNPLNIEILGLVTLKYE